MAASPQIYKGFCGATYTNRSIAADGEVAFNIFPEQVESGEGKNDIVLYRVPGKKLFMTLPTFPHQAEYELNGRAWSVSGNTVYEVFSNGTAIPRGTVTAPPAGEYISIASNHNQLMIVSDPNGYILDLTSNILTQITDDGFAGGVTVANVQGFFVANNPRQNRISVSSFNNGLTWSGIDQESTQDYGDNLVAVANFLNYLQLWSTRHAQCYYDSGSNSALFARLDGSYQYQGLAAAFSASELDNTLFSLGQNRQGGGMVYRLDGFRPKRVSNYSVEDAIQSYVPYSDAVSYPYQDGGHMFYNICFPSANGGLGANWCYDVNTNMWHQRGHWNTQLGKYEADIGRFYMHAFQKHLVGDYRNGNLYEMSMAYTDDAGDPIRWMRSAPQISTLQFQNTYRYLQLDMQTGVGLDGTGLGTDPVVNLNISEDGGFTWGADLAAPIGKIGDFKAQVTWNNLGLARDFVARVWGTDPNVLCLVNAYLGVDQGKS
jgi:hypothetical protein